MRALSLASFYDYGAMTLEECANDCAGYLYFGVEYGGECKLFLPYGFDAIGLNMCSLLIE
jgi:hypothetical protein